MNSFLLMLRVAPGDSFPRPLSRQEEEACLARWAEGDVEARNTLVEHNLRLVAHILKKYYAQADDAEDLLRQLVATREAPDLAGWEDITETVVHDEADFE